MAAVVVLTSGLAYGQSASQVTPIPTPPTSGAPIAALVFPGTPGLGAPDGADALFVTLSGVEITGGKPELAAKEEEVRAALAGRRVSVAEIFSKARDLEAAYNQAGFFLVRVVVPAQRLTDGGNLQLSVVEGFIERVDTANVPERVRRRVERMVAPLVGRPDITMKEVERRLLLITDTPGLTLKTALATGERPGGTVLVINGELDVVIPFIGFDNTLPPGLGTWVVHTGVDFNSLMGAGGTIYFRGSTHPEANDAAGMFGSFDDDPRFRSLTAGVLAPIGIKGHTLNLEGVVTQTTPAPIGLLQTSSIYERFSARWSYPFVRSRKMTLKGTFTFDAANETQNAIIGGTEFSLFEDRLRVFRGTLEGTWTPAGTLTASATASVGIVEDNPLISDVFPFPVPNSRQGMDDTFGKLEGKLGYSQTVSAHFAFTLSGRAQTSFGQPLAQSEQFSIANISELSTFDSGALSGDSGWVVRLEPSFPFTIDRPNADFVIAPYVFGAVGAVYLHEPTILESAQTVGASAGVGVKVAGMVGKVESSLVVEYGWAYRDPGPEGQRLTVAGSLRF